MLDLCYRSHVLKEKRDPYLEYGPDNKVARYISWTASYLGSFAYPGSYAENWMSALRQLAVNTVWDSLLLHSIALCYLTVES